MCFNMQKDELHMKNADWNDIKGWQSSSSGRVPA
jgi:hypothetical protein